MIPGKVNSPTSIQEGKESQCSSSLASTLNPTFLLWNILYSFRNIKQKILICNKVTKKYFHATLVHYHYAMLHVPWEAKLSRYRFWFYITSCCYLRIPNLQVYLSIVLHKLSNKFNMALFDLNINSWMLSLLSITFGTFHERFKDWTLGWAWWWEATMSGKTIWLLKQFRMDFRNIAELR